MPRYIVKLSNNDKEYFLEWSTIVDAPVTFGMGRKEFEEYYRGEYGENGMRDLPERMARVDATGVSAIEIYTDAKSLVDFNRAGKNETCLTVEQIIDAYCVHPTDKPPIGKDLSDL